MTPDRSAAGAVALAAVGLGAALVWSWQSRGQDTPADVLRALVDQTGVAGGVVAWGAPGGPVETAAAGLADPATGRPMTAADRLPIASLTKPVTAALVLDRIDAGLVALDTPLSEVASDAPSDVTIGQAMAHLGGWTFTEGRDPYFRPLAELSTQAGGQPVGSCRDVAVLPDVAPTQAPGLGYAYSNVGYCWLGEIFAEAGGYAAAVAAAHGERFSLDRATATVSPDGLDPEVLAWAVMQPGMAGPFGGLVTDAASYLAFALEPVDPRTMLPPPVAWEVNYYGLGWRVWPRGEAVYLTHYGSMPGVFSFVIRRADGGAAVLLLNGSVADHAALARNLAERLMAMPGWQ